MAESSVTFLLKKLTALSQEELKLLGGVWGDVKEIRDEFERMKAFLWVADTMEESDQEVKVWVKQVRDVVYDTEDVLDEFKLHVAPNHHWQGAFGFVPKILHFVLKLKARYRIASKMKGIKSRVRNISEGHERYRYKNNVGEEGSSSTGANRRCHDRRGDALLLDEAELVGIEKHKKHLIECLLEDEPGLKVVSVVGMGGMGKTTLVKKVYDDAQVIKHFQTHVWITVSQSFIIEELLKGIIEKLFSEIKQPVPPEVNNMDSNTLKMKIKELLRQKRFVLVLDDVWSVEAWEALKYALPDCECGSRVLLTTRNSDVASTTCTGFHGNAYHLEPLSPEESWNLFCKKTFRQNRCPVDLEELSLRILRKCRGLPLAIVAISGLLSTKDKNRVDEWERVHRSLGAELEGNNKLESMKKILSLSYDDLPYYLKACFLYMSIFPEDYTIKRMRMIRVWMAEGFIEVREGQMPEEVAEAYLNELVNRSLVQIARTTRNGRVSTCRIHDLMREIVVSKSKDLNFVVIANANTTLWPEKVRRLTVHGMFENVPERKRVSQVRSLFMFKVPVSQSKSALPAFLTGARLIKVLDLQGSLLETIPIEVFKLYHLSYLSLRGTKVNKIPCSIGKLTNLETLDLKHTHVTELPVEILRLKQLRHLLVYRYVKGSSSPFGSTYAFKAPSGMGVLQSLQKLCFVEANHGSDVLSELGKLTQLRKLGITKLRRDDGMTLCSSIEKLRNLRSLDVSSTDEQEIIDIQGVSSPPPYLQRLWLQGRLEKLPPWIQSMYSLVKLRLRWSRLGYDPLEALQALPNLVELQLRQAYDGDALHFKAGGFQGLKTLHLHDLVALRLVTVEEGAMPYLEELGVICCRLLQIVPTGVEFLTKLKSLSFADNSPNELMMKLQGKQGDEYTKIMKIPEVKITFKDGNRWKQISIL